MFLYSLPSLAPISSSVTESFQCYGLPSVVLHNSYNNLRNGPVIILTLHMRNLKHKEARHLAQRLDAGFKARKS